MADVLLLVEHREQGWCLRQGHLISMGEIVDERKNTNHTQGE